MAAKPAVKEQAVARAVKLRLVGTIASMTDELFDLREQKRALEEQMKAIETQYDSVAETLMAKLDAEGTSKGDGKKAAVSISMSTVASVTDWDAFGAWVIKSKNVHLFQRRVSDAAWREIFEKKGAIPGTEPFTKKRLNLRVL